MCNKETEHLYLAYILPLPSADFAKNLRAEYFCGRCLSVLFLFCCTAASDLAEGIASCLLACTVLYVVP